MNVQSLPGLAGAVVSVVREKGHLSGQDMEAIARELRVPTSRVYGFCSQFPEFTRPPGRPLLRLCSGPACAAVDLGEEAERWRGELGARAELSRVPGLPQPHRSPALEARLPGEEERLIEGFDIGVLEELTKSLDRRDLSAYPLPEERRFPGVAGIPEGGMSPWLAFLHGKRSLPPLDAGVLEEVSRDPAPILGFLEEECGIPSLRARAGPPDLLVCDTVGPSPEGSVDLLVSRSCPRAVASGAVLAAAAERVEIPPGTRRILVLEQPTCMAKWSRSMLVVAGEDCCGGCTPGRTAPAAASSILGSMADGGDGEEGLREVAGLLEKAELLALCPQLRRIFPVVQACLDLFPEDFQSRSDGGNGSESMASSSGKARGMGGRR